MIASYSAQLDLVVQGMIARSRTVVAMAIMIQKVRNSVLGHPLTVMVPHAVKIVLTQQGHSLVTH